MSTRSLTALGVLTALLAVVGYFVFFGDEATPDVTPPEQVQEQQPDTVELRGDSESEVPAARRTAVGNGDIGDTTNDDPVFQKALTGFKGRVVNQDGLPVADSVVRMAQIHYEAFLQNPGLFAMEGDHFEPKDFVQDTKTDDEGRFLLRGFWPRSVYMMIADAEGDNPTSRFVQETPAPGQVVDLGDIKLQQYGVIVGRVVNDDGDPVEGAMVRAVDLPGAMFDVAPVERFDPRGGVIVAAGANPFVFEMASWVERYFRKLHEYAHIPLTHTDGDGNFRLRGVVPGKDVVVISKRELLPVVKKGVGVKPGKETKLRKVRLTEGEIASGSVVDEQDEPIAGAQVMAASRNLLFPVHFANFLANTNKEGLFEGGGFAPGDVLIAARRRKGDPWVVTEPQAVAKQIVVKLPSEYSLTVRVKSNAGRDIEAPRFKLASGPANPVDFVSMGMGSWVSLDKRTQELDDGRYKFSDLQPGSYTLAVVAEGHGASTISVDIDKDVEKEIVLEPSLAVPVVVHDPSGKPLRNAAIYYMVRPKNGGRLHQMPLTAGRTNKEGRLEIRDAKAGKMRLTARHPAFANANKEVEVPTNNDVILTMVAPGSIDGVLTDNGERPTSGEWMIILTSRGGGARGAMPPMPSFKTPLVDGRFRFDGLLPGRYRLQVAKSADAANSPGGTMAFVLERAMLRDGANQNVDVTAGAVAQVRIDTVKQPEAIAGPTAQISGTVLINGLAEEGVIITGSVSVKNRRAQRISGKTDQTGAFDLGRVAVGTVRLKFAEPLRGDLFALAKRGGTLYETRRTVEAGQNYHWQINIGTSTVEGVVVGPDGAPVADAQVRGRGVKVEENSTSKNKQTARSRRDAVTDSRGRFKMESVPAGTYTFTVSGEAGVGSVKDVVVRAGIFNPNVQIRLRKTYRVNGSVDLSVLGDEKPRWLGMQLERMSKPSRSEWVNIDRRTGKFRSKFLEPGTYTARVFVPGKKYGWQPGQKRLMATEPIVVGAQMAKDVKVQLQVVDAPPPVQKPTPARKAPAKNGAKPGKRRNRRRRGAKQPAGK